MNDQVNENENPGFEPDPVPGQMSEEQITDLLGQLNTPPIPTEVAERISHALAAEAPLAGTRTAAKPTPPTSLDEKRAERSQRSGLRSNILGAIAGVAAVGVLGIVGLQVLDNKNSNELATSDGQSSSPSATWQHDNGVAYASTPVLSTGTTYSQASLDSQVQQQLPKWKRAQAQVQANPAAIHDIDLDGVRDAVQGKSSARVLAAHQMRERLSDCLASLNRENSTPLVVDMAELRNESNTDLQNVAVVALPQDSVPVQQSDKYEVYFMGVNCNRDATQVMAQLTVPNSPSN